jgi:ribulose-5-phosphate 4-epimerase/fuculose-1-phosphate aldolase
MEHLIDKYLGKLEAQRLAKRDDAVFLSLDAELISNRPVKDDVKTLSRIFGLMNINTILFAEPSEPYKSILDEILRYDAGCTQQARIVPLDCEMRTFFHDIPVVNEFSPEAIAEALSQRKSVIVRNRGIVTYGMVTPEQAFVSFSSTCFSTFVKYFYDVLTYRGESSAGGLKQDKDFVHRFRRTCQFLREELMVGPSDGPVQQGEGHKKAGSLMTGPPGNGEDVIAMLSEAGRAVVERRLVDSFFGNISFAHNGIIYISQTGSSLDELEGSIDAVPLDGSSSIGITASSELSAHRSIYREIGDQAILHGHPKFSVIMSMHCLKEGCPRDLCHKACKEKREVAGIPVVSGEVGTGPTGLLHTVPLEMKGNKGVIVYGHGVFTSGRDDFRKPFRQLLDIETACREEYFRLAEDHLTSHA